MWTSHPAWTSNLTTYCLCASVLVIVVLVLVVFKIEKDLRVSCKQLLPSRKDQIVKIGAQSVTPCGPPCLNVDLKVRFRVWRTASDDPVYRKNLKLAGVWQNNNEGDNEPELYEKIPSCNHQQYEEVKSINNMKYLRFSWQSFIRRHKKTQYNRRAPFEFAGIWIENWNQK